MLLKLWAALNIEVINSSAQNPPSRGKAEKAVGIVKMMLRKFLSTTPNEVKNWEAIPFIISKIYNHTVSLKTGYKPIEMIQGQGKISKAFFEQENLVPLHHSIRNNPINVEIMTQQLREMAQRAQDNIVSIKERRDEKLNKTRINKEFEPGDIVYALDRYTITGVTRPLKCKFYPSPCVVVQSYYTTTLIRRLADNFESLYSNNHIKKFKHTSPLMKDLPPPVQEIVLNNFQDLLE